MSVSSSMTMSSLLCTLTMAFLHHLISKQLTRQSMNWSNDTTWKINKTFQITSVSMWNDSRMATSSFHNCISLIKLWMKSGYQSESQDAKCQQHPQRFSDVMKMQCHLTSNLITNTLLANSIFLRKAHDQTLLMPLTKWQGSVKTQPRAMHGEAIKHIA